MLNPVGRTLGRYQILKYLASGGMADVYLARSSGLEGFVRHVVIKRIRAIDARDADYVKMFLDEARLAATLHHHNVVQVHDVGQEGDEYYLAMEYIHGKDARAVLMKAVDAKEHLPLEHVVAIVASAAAGLHHAHEQLGPDRTPLGLVHRDVSPSNILVGYDGGVKVADFGIAKAAQRSVETHSGTLKGKVAYMSPEQCRGKPVDRRSDVFALGIVLYELASARRLFKAESEFLTMSAIVGGIIPPPSKFRPDLPAGLEAIIMKALANDPAERYPTANALRLALEELANAVALRMSTTSLADYMTRLFGTRIEPWLDDAAGEDERAEKESSGSGLARAPSSISDVDVAPDAPIVAARRRAITSVPAVDDSEAPPLVSRPSRASMPIAAVHDPTLQRKHRIAWVASGVAALALGGVGIAKLASGSSNEVAAAPTAVAPAPAPAPAPPPPPAPAPPPPPAPPPASAAASPAAAATPAPATTPDPAPPRTRSNATAAPPTSKPKPGHPTKVVKKPQSANPHPDPDWDRTSLFPK